MRITPLDVRKQEFRRSVRGYDCDEVRAFLSTLADEYEAVLMDNKQVREQMVEFEEKIAEYRNMERTLRDTLLTAERITKEARENADKEGGLIVKDAHMKAKQVLEECRMRTGELRREIHALRQEKEAYLARFKGLAEAQIQFIDTHRRDFDDVDKRLLQMMDSVTYDAQGSQDAPAPPEIQQTDPVIPAAARPAGSETSDDIWRRYKAGQSTGPVPNPAPEPVPEPVPEPAPESLSQEFAPPAVEIEDVPAPSATTIQQETEPAPQPAPVEKTTQEIKIPWSNSGSETASIGLAAMGIPVAAVEEAGTEQPEPQPVTFGRDTEELPRDSSKLDAQQEAILDALQETPQEITQEVTPKENQDQQPARPEVPPSWVPEKHDLWDTLTT